MARLKPAVSMRATATQDGPPEPTGQLHVIENRAQKWRFKCANPPHHDDWRLWNSVLYCRTCAGLRDSGKRDVDPVMDRLWDAKEKVFVPRERITIER